MAKKRNGGQKTKTSQGLVYRSQQVHPKLVEHVSGLVNPFAPTANGSKLHDENASKTFTFQSRQIVDVTAGLFGTGYTEIGPTIKDYLKRTDANDNTINDQAVTGSGANYDSFDIADYTELSAGSIRYRVVSWGVRITAPYMTETELKGTLLVRELSYTRALTNVDQMDLSDSYVNVPISKDLDITIIPNHIGDTYKEFIQPTSTFSSLDTTSLGWNGIGLTILGSPAGETSKLHSVLQAEVVYNLEILPKITSMVAHMATPPAPHDYGIMQSVHNTRTSLPLAHKTSGLWSKVKSFATSALKSLGHYALDRFSGGLLNYVESRPALKNAGQLLLTNG